MKMQVLGAKHVGGTSKAGSEFDIHALIVRVPIESGSFGKVRIAGAGYETADVDLDPAALPQFLALQGRYPLELELLTEQKFHRGEFKTFVIGHTEQPHAAVRPVASGK